MKWTAFTVTSLCVSALLAPVACNRDVSASPSAEPAQPAAPAAAAVAAASSDSPAAAPAELAAAARFEDESFELTAVPKGPYAAGKPGAFEIVLSARNGYKCNDQYPYKFKAKDSADIEFGSKVVGADALKLEKQRAVMTVAFTPKSAGKKTVEGNFSFSVCTEERCLVERRDLALSVDVN